MSTVQNRGRITNTNQTNGGMSYVRKQPGISFPTDTMTPEEIKDLSGPVTVYKMGFCAEKTMKL